MEPVSRRSIVKGAVAGAMTIGAGVYSRTSKGEEPKVSERWTLEGELKVHPKFLYRYYLVVLGGQTCALYGRDHGREQEQLSNLPLPARVRVRGTLGTEQHSGGTKGNPSPFPSGWWVYMDVHEVEMLK